MNRYLQIALRLTLMTGMILCLAACGGKQKQREKEFNTDKELALTGSSVGTPAGVKMDTLSERSVTYAEQIVSGLMASVQEHFSDELAEQMSLDRLQASWDSVAANVSGYQGVEDVSETVNGEYLVELVTLRYEQNQGRTIQFVFDDREQIVGIWFDATELGAASSSGSSARPTRDYEETEVTVGRDPYPLQGILTVPKQEQKPPVVILIPDGRDLDMDGTIGLAQNKPLQDLARGLAICGVASLRYEQRMYHYQKELPKDTGSYDAIVQDAGYAVSQMYNEKKVSRSGIYFLVMGSSASYLPVMVADKPKRLKGAILMGAKPTAVSEKTYGGDKEKNLSSDASYFIEENSTFPLLVLQGEAVFETPVKSFEQWKKLWKGRSHTSYRSFRKLNHYFMKTTGAADRSDYDEVGSVNPDVIQTIANWVLEES